VNLGDQDIDLAFTTPAHVLDLAKGFNQWLLGTHVNNDHGTQTDTLATFDYLLAKPGRV
jgi:hypothetical protein